MRTMADALREHGFSDCKTKRGEIWTVPDHANKHAVEFPEDKIGKGKRTFHGDRLVMIAQCGSKVTPDTVIVAPCSSQPGGISTSVSIPGEYNHNGTDTHARLHLMQYILRSHLKRKVGEVPRDTETMKIIDAQTCQLLGLL